MFDEHRMLIDRYIHDKIPTGSAFQSIIEGNPKIWKMDASVRANLAEIMEYVFVFVPIEARGSREKYKAWCGFAENIPDI